MKQVSGLLAGILVVLLMVLAGCGGVSDSSSSSSAQVEGYFDGVHVFLEKNDEFIYVFLRNENNWPVDVTVELAENLSFVSLQPMQEYEATMTTGNDPVILWVTIGWNEYQFSI